MESFNGGGINGGSLLSKMSANNMNKSSSIMDYGGGNESSFKALMVDSYSSYHPSQKNTNLHNLSRE
jgi:hypothetical protein